MRIFLCFRNERNASPESFADSMKEADIDDFDDTFELDLHDPAHGTIGGGGRGVPLGEIL